MALDLDREDLAPSSPEVSAVVREQAAGSTSSRHQDRRKRVVTHLSLIASWQDGPYSLMRILVCGLNRSGTSAMATYLWQAVGGTLLDDPGWVYAIPDGIRLHARVPDFRAQLQQSLVVKAPRFNERLLDVLEEFPDARAVVMVRNAEDVLASILQKTRRARAATRMLNFDRFGPYDSVVEGFLNEYQWYMRQTTQATISFASPSHRVCSSGSRPRLDS